MPARSWRTTRWATPWHGGEVEDRGDAGSDVRAAALTTLFKPRLSLDNVVEAAAATDLYNYSTVLDFAG